ncbi:MAG: MarR family transcriptional regulator [Anaerolineae bacterium]|nr:MarR family transcriptional regulator [Anaerolineae bacterium]
MNDIPVELIEQIIRIVNKFHQIEERPRFYGTPDLIYVSEIHVIDIAARYPDLNLSQIADKLGVTRGAVWQTVKKLEEKGLAQRFHVAGNRREIFIQLSQQGRLAFNGFRQVLERKETSISAILGTLSDQELNGTAQILQRLEVFLDQVREE